MVLTGSLIEVDLTGTWDYLSPTTASTVDAARGDLVSALSAFFDVHNITITTPSVVGSVINANILSSPYTAVVVVVTRVDYAQPRDAGSIVATYFASEFGSVPTFTLPAYEGAQAPAATTVGPDVTGGLSTGLTAVTDTIANVAKNVETQLGHASLLLVGGLVLIVAVIAFSPAGTTAARAVRV